MTKKMSTHDFLSLVLLLAPGESIDFYNLPYDERGQVCAGITRVDAFGAAHLLANYYGGGYPFIFDVTCYDSGLKKLEEAFVEWLPGFCEDVERNASPNIHVLPARRGPGEKGTKK